MWIVLCNQERDHLAVREEHVKPLVEFHPAAFGGAQEFLARVEVGDVLVFLVGLEVLLHIEGSQLAPSGSIPHTGGCHLELVQQLPDIASGALHHRLQSFGFDGTEPFLTADHPHALNDLLLGWLH